MRYRSSTATALLGVLTACAVGASLHAQTLPAPPDDLPQGSGPRGTSQVVPGQERYDDVGYAAVLGGSGGGDGTIGAVHRSLPVGTFVEVTSLDSGKTIAVMIGSGSGSGGALPGDRLIGLTPAAAHMLGIEGASLAAVRVRRIDANPTDQAALRSGRAGSERLDAPKLLLVALRKRLPAAPKAVDVASPVTPPVATPPPKANGSQPHRAPGASYHPPEAPRATAPPRAPVAIREGGLYVQIAALSTAARATALAQNLHGTVAAGGGLYRVRLGPYRTLAQAQNARDAVARRGYGDARIVSDH